MPDDRAARRVGGPAHQGPVLLLRRQGRVLRQQGRQDQVADRRVPLPALRPRPDVGDDGRRDHRRGRRGPPQRAGRRTSRSRDGQVAAVIAGGERIEPSEVISSLPLRATVGLSGAAAAGEVQAAAQGLRYRDFLTVALVIDGEDLFPDNWIYIHEPSVQVGRIQNYRSWSPWMVPDESKACVGLEYFCFSGDELWEIERRGARRARQAGARPARPGRPGEGRARLRHARAARLSDVRRGLRRARRRDPRLARGRRQPPAGRAQRPAPVQQLGPLDADRDPRGGQHPHRRRRTTSGPSTPSPSTTRKRSRTSTRTSGLPRRARCASRSSREG